MLTIVITAVWLVVVILVLGACRVAAFADAAIDELAYDGRSSRRLESRLKADGGSEVLLLPSQPV